MLFRRIGLILLFLAATANADPIKLVIVGGGHIGLMTALLAHQEALKNGEDLHLSMFEKNPHVTNTTAGNIWNSHTPDEILAVVPRGTELEEKLEIPFDQPGGIFVSDVKGTTESPSAQRFIDNVKREGPNEVAHQRRTELLLQLGRAGMQAWKNLFDNADDDLKGILQASNFNRCCENDGACAAERFNGYRIDLIYDMDNAQAHAEGMAATYGKIGYKRSRILSPDEVEERDPSLASFCASQSVGAKGARQWKSNASAVWRPGGCLDTQRFLPKLADYLAATMGTYRDKNGETKNRFTMEFNKKATEVFFEKDEQNRIMVNEIGFADGSKTEFHKNYKNVRYIFAPGESVGTLEKLGFAEPAYAGFAGASLSLEINTDGMLPESLQKYNHFMEVHRPGTVLAWQGRIRDGKLFLGGAGTKAFYGEEIPTLDDEFARVKNLLQLQMFNDVMPEIVTLALGEDSKGKQMTFANLDQLVEKGIARRWVGRRGVAFDGFFTAGALYHEGAQISNAQATTHLSSGGGSFSVIAAMITQYANNPERIRKELADFDISEELANEVLRYADSRR